MRTIEEITNKKEAWQELVQANEELKRKQEELEAVITKAREVGTSWEAIGNALDLSKQTAFNRYNKATQPKNDVEKHHAQTVKFLDGQEPAKGRFNRELAYAEAENAKISTPAKPSKKLDRKAPAKRYVAANRTEYSILDSPFSWQVTVPEGAQPGTGKGPHACPSCGSTNHKGATNHRLEFNADCTPTKYDPAYIIKFMKLTQAK